MLQEADRYLLYYSARYWGNMYGAGDGTIRIDADGIYRHIGVAICEKDQLAQQPVSVSRGHGRWLPPHRFVLGNVLCGNSFPASTAT